MSTSCNSPHRVHHIPPPPTPTTPPPSADPHPSGLSYTVGAIPQRPEARRERKSLGRRDHASPRCDPRIRPALRLGQLLERSEAQQSRWLTAIEGSCWRVGCYRDLVRDSHSCRYKTSVAVGCARHLIPGALSRRLPGTSTLLMSRSKVYTCSCRVSKRIFKPWSNSCASHYPTGAPDRRVQEPAQVS